jgi:hypothetical protein
MSESVFVQKISNQLERVKEIISSPYKLNQHYQTVIQLHNTIESDIIEYMNISERKIVEDVVNLCKPIINEYKNKAIQDIPKHQIKINNVINYNKPENTNIIEIVDPSKYDELYQNVDLSMDPDNLTKENKQMIKNYMTCKEDLIAEFDDLIYNIKRYEQNMINRRQQLYNDAINSIIPQLYKSHLSYVKLQSNMKKNKQQNTNQINVEIKNIPYQINQKQTEFMLSMLNKCLSE